jgi:hypothetical protein
VYYGTLEEEKRSCRSLWIVHKQKFQGLFLFTSDEAIKVERDSEDTIHLQHFMTQKSLTCAGEGKIAYLTEFPSQSLEFVAWPVLKSDTIIRTNHSYHLVAKSNLKLTRKQHASYHPRSQKADQREAQGEVL